MRWTIVVLLCLLALTASYVCHANMASPLSGGTQHAMALTSRDVSVLHEWIQVKPEQGFGAARFDITYEIETAVEGKQMPLLFIARDFIGGFQLTVDGKPVPLLNVPDSILQKEPTLFNAFEGAAKASDNDHDPQVSVTYDGDSYELVRLSELLYFRLDLSKGVHRINLVYKAEPELDRSDWIRKYRHNYSLSPARHWKSFGPLDLVIDGRSQSNGLTTNLRDPDSGSLTGLAVWHFKALPADFIQITYIPKTTALAQIMLAIRPEGLAAALAVLLFALHVWTVVRYRRRGGVRKVSLSVVLGSLVYPLVFLIGWIFFYSLIDFVIGPEASARHGYEFLLLGFYLVITPVYLIVMLCLDTFVKRSYAAKQGHAG